MKKSFSSPAIFSTCANGKDDVKGATPHLLRGNKIFSRSDDNLQLHSKGGCVPDKKWKMATASIIPSVVLPLALMSGVGGDPPVLSTSVPTSLSSSSYSRVSQQERVHLLRYLPINRVASCTLTEMDDMNSWVTCVATPPELNEEIQTEKCGDASHLTRIRTTGDDVHCADIERRRRRRDQKRLQIFLRRRDRLKNEST